MADSASPSSPRFKILALAASAGGLHAIEVILKGLSPDMPIGIVIVQHLKPDFPTQIAAILTRTTAFPVVQVKEGDQVAPGKAFIAPPGLHLLVNPDGVLSLSRAELVHFSRPSADLLFESVAASYKDQAIAVVLTGAGMDGAMGVEAIKKMGGVVIAQTITSSEFCGMPEAAIRTGCVDYVLPLEEIHAALISLIYTGAYL